MTTYRVEFSLTGATIALLLIVPLLIMTPLLVGLAFVENNYLSETLLLILIGVIITGGILLTVWLYRRYASIPCDLTIREEGIAVQLLRRSFLYSVTHYESDWGNIRNVSVNYEPRNNRKFYQVSFRKPDKTITLVTREKVNSAEEETEFEAALMSYVNRFNQNNAGGMKIQRRGFYESTWAKWITYLTVIMTFVVVVIRIADPSAIPLWRVFAFLSYSVIWLTVYFANNRKK